MYGEVGEVGEVCEVCEEVVVEVVVVIVVVGADDDTRCFCGRRCDILGVG